VPGAESKSFYKIPAGGVEKNIKISHTNDPNIYICPMTLYSTITIGARADLKHRKIETDTK